MPAGSDAALYLVGTRGLDEGNYWVSLKETVGEGEVLTHIEVGLEGDTAVQGLSGDGDVGAVQFLLPNEEITQEIAEQVGELLEGSDAGTQGSGVWGMSAGEELDWSRAEVVLLGNPAEGEEVEALLVIPAVDDEAGGQALWGRTRATINPQKATYARVKVKKGAQGSAGGIQVTSTDVQPRPGRELPPVFRYCPYQYYGRLSPFRRVLCENYWEIWYGKDYKRLRTLVPRAEYLETQALTYNQLVAAGARPLLLLQDNEVRVGLYGFPGDLSGEDLEELLQYIRDLGNGKTQLHLRIHYWHMNGMSRISERNWKNCCASIKMT